MGLEYNKHTDIGLIEKIKNKIKGKNIEILTLAAEDVNIFNFIKRKGGLEEFPSYAYFNNTYYTVIRVHTYNEELQNFWLTKFSYMPNIIIELEVDTEDKHLIKKAINKKIGLEDFKLRKARSYTEARDANDEILENKKMYEEIKVGNSLNSISLNFILKEKSLDKLEKLIEKVDSMMKDYDVEGNIFMNNIIEDLKMTKYKNGTQTITPTNVLKTFFPFNFQDIVDESGTYFGKTATGGKIVLDHTIREKESRRLTNDILVTGKTGSGKSTIVKAIIKKEQIQGHYHIILDPEEEYTDLVQKMGGKVIDVSKNSIINPLEYRIFGVEDENEYLVHKDNIKEFLKLLNPELEFNDLARISSFLDEFYKLFFKANDIDVTKEVKSKEFPIFSEFYEFVKGKVINIEEEKDEDNKIIRDREANSYDKILLTLKEVTTTYKNYFDGITEFDMSKEQRLVSFNLKPVEDLNKNIKNAIVFNILNIYCNDKVMKSKIYNEGLVKSTGQKNRIQRVILDEAYVFLNVENPTFVSWYHGAVKRFRKYWGASIIIGRVLDFKPLNIDSTIGEQLLQIYKETVYKYFLFQELPESGREYENISDMLNLEDIKKINNFKQGQFILKLPQRKIIGEHIIDKYESKNLYATENNMNT